MNDIKKQEQEPSTPEQAETQKPDSAVKAGSSEGNGSPQGPSKSPRRMALLALLLAVLSLGVSYTKLSGIDSAVQQDTQALADLKKRMQEAKGRLDEYGKALEGQQAAFKAQEERLQQERAELDEQTEEMKHTIDMVFERVGRDSTQWIAAEAEYLMRIANHRLQLEGDTATALVALQGADKRLHDSADPIWTGVREKLATEMAELKGIRQLDMTGQVAMMSGLISQVDKLRLPHSPPESGDQPKDTADQEKGYSFDRVLQDMWTGVKSLLVIRRNDRPLTAMLEPEQRFFLYQNLRLQLESARLALLRRDQALFVESLQRAETWIKEFFDQEQPLAKSMLEEIGGLKGLELETKMPDISGSLRLMLKQLNRADEAPIQANEASSQANQGSTEPETTEEQASTDQQLPAEESKQADQGQVPADAEQKPVSEGTGSADQGQAQDGAVQEKDAAGQVRNSEEQPPAQQEQVQTGTEQKEGQ